MKPLTVAGTGDPPSGQSQMLTVTGEGVWIDGERARRQRAHLHLDDDLLRAHGARRQRSGDRRAGASPRRRSIGHAGLRTRTARTAAERSIAEHRLGEPVAVESSANASSRGSPRGQPASGRRCVHARARAREAPGPSTSAAAYGAAFSNPREGWLGQAALPVHLTLNPVASRLTPWPVSVPPRAGRDRAAARRAGRFARTARRSPSATAARSRAINRARGGCRKACSAPAGGGRRRGCAGSPGPPRPRLRGRRPRSDVAWRGETGLWEPDPATP